MPPKNLVKVVLFDTFGTIVDWRTSITNEITTIAGYAPGMAAVTAGQRPFVSIDVIHRERLDSILPAFGLGILTESERADLNNAWHRLSPWPDSCAGLARIKAKFMIGPLSNGSLLLLA
ncbi:MAG: haloacid dehalogenase type II, partial [Candidatus Puniceispirillum sp.]